MFVPRTTKHIKKVYDGGRRICEMCTDEFEIVDGELLIGVSSTFIEDYSAFICELCLVRNGYNFYMGLTNNHEFLQHLDWPKKGSLPLIRRRDIDA